MELCRTKVENRHKKDDEAGVGRGESQLETGVRLTGLVQEIR